MRPLAILVALAALAAAGPAAAAPKIPAALDGVELRKDLVSVQVDRRPRRLGGRDVLVFRQTYRYRPGDHDGGRKDAPDGDAGAKPKATATDLAVVDATTLEYLVVLRIADRDAAGTISYAPTWKDLGGDKDPELILTRRKASGDRTTAPKQRVLQVRQGRFVDTTRDLARCHRAAGDTAALGEDGPDPASVIELFLRIPTRCGYAEALIAARLELPEHPIPARDATIAVARAAADCPAASWAARHGKTVGARHTLAFVTAEGRLAVATVTDQGSDLDVGVVDLDGIARLEARTVDQHLYLLAVQAGKAVVFDPVRLRVVAEAALEPGEAPGFVDDRAGNRLEVVARARQATRSLWSLEVVAW